MKKIVIASTMLLAVMCLFSSCSKENIEPTHEVIKHNGTSSATSQSNGG